ncbi:MAG: ATP-binding protein [Chloroflexi bacterium]|jgi:hypothetical protein|nr:ATP-binding protein [Chloroflexota bacterium]
MNKKYYPRIVDKVLELYLKAFGAVVIKGPKWSGKTTTAEQKANSVLKLQDPDLSENYLALADFKPSLLLEGDTPRLIDEWQMAPVLWDAVRNAVDQRQKTGQFILTGSTVVDRSKMMHSGTGRIAQMPMSTMSLFEYGESNGTVSLNSLFANEPFTGSASSLSVDQLAKAICRGGWPATLTMSDSASLLVAPNYVDGIIFEDAAQLDEPIPTPERIRAILRSYARNISTLASNRAILEDLLSNDAGISESTLYRYIAILNELFVLRDIPAWNPSIRSASAMRASNKRGFSDPSLAIAALGLSPDQLLDDLNTFGFFFESLCIHDLSIYSVENKGHISYYRDRYGLECDIVLHLNNGRYALIEAKLGSKSIDEGAEHLLKLDNLIRQKQMKPPCFMMILTAGQYAYQRKDDVYVVPIGCLGP